MNFKHIQYHATRAVCAWVFGVMVVLGMAPVGAQNQISLEETSRLRATLDEPIDPKILRSKLEAQLQAKQQAAIKLGDWPTIEAIYRTTMLLFPSELKYKNQFAALVLQRGNLELGNTLMQEVIEASPDPVSRLIFKANFAQYLSDQMSFVASDGVLRSAQQDLLRLPTRLSSRGDYYVMRSRSGLAKTQSQIYLGQGKYQLAIQQANDSERQAREAIRLVPSDLPQIEQDYAHARLVEALNLKVRVLLSSGNREQLNAVLRTYLQLIQSQQVSIGQQIQAQTAMASIRHSQREFASASALHIQAIDAMRRLNYEALDLRLTMQLSHFSQALIGQKRFPEALAEFQKLDALAGTDEALKNRVRFAFDRAVAYLYNNKALEAAPLLASEAASLAKQYGSGPAGSQHFFTAQASGLQGVALWRIGTAESKAQAYPLLQTAVRDIMSPANVDFLENIGIRKELREMIFSTYIEAASQTSPVEALAALGIADWLRGGLVQEALGDAAVRSAASNTALSDWVRQDQDARNEIKGLRNLLSGEAGGTASPLPAVAAKMRERIALLEQSRSDVQVQIKAKFPDYEKLVRPLPPSTTEIQARLKSEEALLVLQPTDRSTYVWVVNKEGTGQFHRAALSESELKRLVMRLRSTLDVAGQAVNSMPAFDHAASQELYQKLLLPVQSGLAGKTSLIVAAGGVLGQIPFGVLQTAAKDSWLIKQAAITHVPSVAAWLSMRALPHKTAEQPMMAWGDPLFNLALASNTLKGAASEVRKINLTRSNTAVDLEKEDPKSALKYADIPALPETRDELLAIAKTLGADAVKDIILGSQATRESVLAANKNGSLAKRRVVAFATHGLMAGDLPNLTQPALAMAGTKDDAANLLAPLLTLEDVLTLKLNADWVVLSACNTAAADGKAEEALSGLARGFFYAGSRSLLVTHWAVDSDSAVTLTTETFRHYQNNPTAQKAESLRQAMLSVLADPKTAHPAFWAPYALVGDGAR